jgi:hypothetical protein
MFSALLSPNFLPSFGKIVGANFELCRHSRTDASTDARTDGGYLVDPFGLQPKNSQGWLHIYIYIFVVCYGLSKSFCNIDII